MKTKKDTKKNPNCGSEISESLESYFKTDNEHWNNLAFSMLCEVLQQGQFENKEIPLQLLSNSIDIFMENHENPLQAVELFTNEMQKYNLTTCQSLFIYEHVCKYLKQSEFEGMDLKPIQKILDSHKLKLKIDSQPITPLTKNIRQSLKELLQKEIADLPATLKELEPAQRLNVLCKLIPFVLPKVESIEHTEGEPKNESTDFDWGDFLK